MEGIEMEMKKLFSTVFLAFLIATVPSQAFSAWWYEEYIGQDRKENSDSEFQFKIGDIVCIIGKTEFARGPDGTIEENRILTCLVSEGVPEGGRNYVSS